MVDDVGTEVETSFDVRFNVTMVKGFLLRFAFFVFVDENEFLASVQAFCHRVVLRMVFFCIFIDTYDFSLEKKY